MVMMRVRQWPYSSQNEDESSLCHMLHILKEYKLSLGKVKVVVSDNDMAAGTMVRS